MALHGADVFGFLHGRQNGCQIVQGARMVTYCRAPYDVAAAQEEIRQAGLPAILADRLSKGR